MNRTLYEEDFVAWTEEQASLLRSGDLSGLDREHLAEEIESVGASERREIRNRLTRLVQHLLKWKFQPEHRSRSWAATIRTQRDELGSVLEDSPSLQGFLMEIFPRAHSRGRVQALEETGLLALPETSPWTIEQVVEKAFLPD